MSTDIKESVRRADDDCDPSTAHAVPITGVLRKTPHSTHYILALSGEAAGDLTVEIERDDVVKQERGKTAGDRVTLQVKPTARVTTSFSAEVTNALIPTFIITSAFGQAAREPIPSVPWREIVTPFSRLDVMLNLVDGLAWTECRARGKAECEALHPPGPDRDQCITDKYIQCGERPTLRVDERLLEQLVDLLGGRP
ncbi:MAG: hypothetical protein ACRD2X_27300 [Vicinamibacteraceae bacterium]